MSDVLLSFGVQDAKADVSRMIGELESAFSSSDPVKIKVGLEVDKAALGTFKSQLSQIVNSISLSNGAPITVKINGLGEISSKTEEVKKSLDGVSNSAKNAGDALNTMTKTQIRDRLDEISRMLVTVQDNAAKWADAQTSSASDVYQTYVDQATALEKLMADVKTGNVSLEQYAQRMGEIKSTCTSASSTLKQFFNSAGAQKVLTKESKEYHEALKKTATLLDSVTKHTKEWTASQKGSTSDSYDSLASYRQELELLVDNLKEGTVSAKDFTTRFDEISSGVKVAENAIKSAGENTKTLGEHVAGLAQKFTTWFGVSQAIMLAINSIKKMITTVIELDTAMTELKKVTDETDETYERFLNNAVARAKSVGASLSDVVTATADFARLGYNIDAASQLADTAIIYKNVADGISDISEASESIVSTMQAFGIAASDAMSIVDKFNNVSNNFAISSAGLGESLQKSAAAMYAAGNTLDQTIALTTAANTVVQNPETVGRVLPNGTVMCRKKTAISVKGQRRLRPRKDFVVCARRVRSSTSFCYIPEVITMAKKTGVYVQCEYCGKTVYKTLSQYNKRKQHFCSNKCQSLLKREITFEHRTCEVCGEDMYLSKKSTQRFCSTECQRTWQLGNTGFKNRRFQGGYVKCDNCGNDFLLGKYRLELNTRHFCSTACRQTWYADVWSQSDEWRLESKERAVSLLKNNPAVTQTKPQLAINSMLDSLGITYRNEESYIYYSIDNYLPEFDLAIEVMGDYWHSSPLKYPDSVNDRQRHVISRDKAKHTYLKKFYGIEILYIWESDILKRPEVCTELIRHYIECGGDIQNYHSFNYSVVDGRLELNDVIVRPHQDRRTEIAC